MSILSAAGLSKAFGAKDIFSGISLEIPHGAKIALVGPNGAGKTTLIRILVGQDEPSSGTINRMRGLRIGYLPQRPELLSAQTLWEEMLSAFEALRRREAALLQMAQQISERPDDAELLERYGAAQHAFERDGGYTYETRIKQVLQGLGFEADTYHKPLSLLSGGQRTRALLAKLLLQQPELLVLDEPTNHLDVQAIEWLEGYLSAWRGALLLVSHDRYFMDRVVNTIWELDCGRLESYSGNYSAYLAQRQARWDYHLKLFESERERLLADLDFIKRNIARESTNARAIGKLRLLSRELAAIEQLGLIAYKNARSWSETGVGGVRLYTVAEAEAAIKALKPSSVRPRQVRMRLNLQSGARSGDKVLMTHNLVVGYAAQAPLLRVPDLTLYRGEVAAIIGPNGVGKSTLLKTLLGALPPLAGERKLGAQVKIGYFAQAHESLSEERTLLDEILSVRELPISQARDHLANFLFTGDDVFRTVSTLSGGERGRLALAKLALSGANLLLLDEPTNHLDIPAQEVLQDILAQFEGTILLVSHDRYLINALATQIWSARPGQLDVFVGTYSAYLAEREATKAATAAANATARQARRSEAPHRANKADGLSTREREKRVAQIEADIHQLETDLARLEAELALASANGDVERVRTLGEAYAQAQSALDAHLREWETLLA
ncbi:MAG: ABC transporter ATP-binding protein [Candidatus Thermofonsia Clade 1 bacterium]|uniref:ABC transporter ATP-binding protein n=1 Tax=Candidatus Thermofonsia Clade 1 bacterium TaxID=2364210 RepID=A0A2M8PG44_9CHLR|nr:MAG: ABC transporter ATP-binding protein [Candidatus Thermofonsia Clade 1 bacterium]